MAGSTTSLVLLHFYTGGVVHRCHGWETGTLEVSVFCSFLLFFGLPSHFLIVSVMSCWRREAAIGQLMVVGLGASWRPRWLGGKPEKGRGFGLLGRSGQ
ncbi:hypothetical protein H0E87_001828, partial [Populus deltoides]